MERRAAEEAEGVVLMEDSVQLRELFTDFCSGPALESSRMPSRMSRDASLAWILTSYLKGLCRKLTSARGQSRKEI